MAKKPKSDPIPSSFEDALSQLDTIVDDLEGDSVPLAELVDRYDRGMKLLDACQTKLEEAKQRVATISQSVKVTADETESLAEDVNDELF